MEAEAKTQEKETRWYVLRVVSGKERKVKEYLDKDIVRNGWDTIVMQIFLPVEKVYKVLNGKKVMRERNFYPGYIMMEVADGKLNDDIIQHVSNISNVMHFLTDGKGSKGNIISLRKAEVNKMLGKVDEMSDEGGVTMSEPFIIGETIKIISQTLELMNSKIMVLEQKMINGNLVRREDYTYTLKDTSRNTAVENKNWFCKRRCSHKNKNLCRLVL